MAINPSSGFLLSQPKNSQSAHLSTGSSSLSYRGQSLSFCTANPALGNLSLHLTYARPCRVDEAGRISRLFLAASFMSALKARLDSEIDFMLTRETTKSISGNCQQ